MASGGATKQELHLARVFLVAVHARHADSIYLQLAVVAWLRQESGGIKGVVGNNPFNLRPGPDDAKLRVGVRPQLEYVGHGKYITVGSFSIYKTIEDGMMAAARRLISAGHDWRGYDLAVRALQKSGGLDDAVNFLNALALSAWDGGRYGTDGKGGGTNHLLTVFAQLTQQPIPQSKPAPPPPPPVPRAKHYHKAYKQLAPPVFHREGYIDGFAAAAFYRRRHPRSTQ